MANNTENRSLLVFGATGRTGKYLVQLALQKGYNVTAVARNPAAITVAHKNLQVVKGDVLQRESFENILFGHDAVISCLGQTSLKPTTFFEDGMRNILAAMKTTGVDRMQCISASALDISPKLTWFIRLLMKYVVRKILKNPYASLRKMEELVKNSGTQWTIMRPPRLNDKPAKGKYRYAVNEWLYNPVAINCPDLADYMVNHIFDEATFKGVVEIAY